MSPVAAGRREAFQGAPGVHYHLKCNACWPARKLFRSQGSRRVSSGRGIKGHSTGCKWLKGTGRNISVFGVTGGRRRPYGVYFLRARTNEAKNARIVQAKGPPGGTPILRRRGIRRKHLSRRDGRSRGLHRRTETCAGGDADLRAGHYEHGFSGVSTRENRRRAGVVPIAVIVAEEHHGHLRDHR